MMTTLSSYQSGRLETENVNLPQQYSVNSLSSSRHPIGIFIGVLFNYIYMYMHKITSTYNLIIIFGCHNTMSFTIFEVCFCDSSFP